MSHYEEQRDAEIATESSVDTVLNERGSRYGDFATQAQLSQTLKNTILQHYYLTHGNEKSPQLPPYLIEAISMICHKLARMVNGDPLYVDNFIDISGYSQLVIEQLTSKTRTGA